MDPRSAGQVQRMLHNMISKHNYCRLLQLGVVACEAGASRTRYNVQCAYVPPATMHLSPWLKHCEQCASACLISHIISHHCGRVCCCETHNGLVACVGGAQPRPEQTLSGQGWLGTTRERAQISTKVKRMRQASSVHGLFLHWFPLQTLVTAANTACKAPCTSCAQRCGTSGPGLMDKVPIIIWHTITTHNHHTCLASMLQLAVVARVAWACTTSCGVQRALVPQTKPERATIPEMH